MNYEKIKTLNLVSILVENYGFEIDSDDSTRHDPEKIEVKKGDSFAWILRRGPPTESHKSSEKVGVSVIFAGGGPRWLYSDNREHKKYGSGSIIDWVMANHQETCSTPKKALQYASKKFTKKSHKPAKPDNSDEIWQQEKIKEHITKNTRIFSLVKYLIDERNISKEVLESRRFAGTIRTDKFNNAVFAHRDHSGFTGYTLRNDNYVKFSAHGRKSLWFSNWFENDKAMVITESAIDALSYYQLSQIHKEKDDKRFFSIDGRPTKHQIDLIVKAAERVDTVILAFDNDDAGAEYEEIFLNVLPIEKVRRDCPPHGAKDWNELFFAA